MNGLVDFAFTIQPDGSVNDVQVVQEVPQCFGFAGAAGKVFPRWQFPPQVIDGKAVAVQATYRFRFKYVDLAIPKAP
jgi:outer membrane biosynthesis protein TonB